MLHEELKQNNINHIIIHTFYDIYRDRASGLLNLQIVTLPNK